LSQWLFLDKRRRKEEEEIKAQHGRPTKGSNFPMNSSRYPSDDDCDSPIIGVLSCTKARDSQD